LTAFGIALIALFFYLWDGHRIGDWFRRLFVERTRGDVGEVAVRAWGALRGYARGAFLVAAVDAVLIGAGFGFTAGWGLALPVAVITFLFAFIRFVGAIVAGAVAVLLALALAGPQAALIVLAVVLVTQQLEGNVFQSFIMGDQVSLHPFATVVVVAVGATLLGILGAVVAVPVAAGVHNGASYLRERYGW
jgi:predicted PurR-regulated permease PerM